MRAEAQRTQREIEWKASALSAAPRDINGGIFLFTRRREDAEKNRPEPDALRLGGLCARILCRKAAGTLATNCRRDDVLPCCFDADIHSSQLLVVIVADCLHQCVRLKESETECGGATAVFGERRTTGCYGVVRKSRLCAPDAGCGKILYRPDAMQGRVFPRRTSGRLQMAQNRGESSGCMRTN